MCQAVSAPKNKQVHVLVANCVLWAIVYTTHAPSTGAVKYYLVILEIDIPHRTVSHTFSAQIAGGTGHQIAAEILSSMPVFQISNGLQDQAQRQDIGKYLSLVGQNTLYAASTRLEAASTSCRLSWSSYAMSQLTGIAIMSS